MAVKVCFMGGARYSSPLDPTSDKKFRALTTLGSLFVIGFSRDLRPRRFDQYARFYLLPNLSAAVLRYAELFMIGIPLALWLILRRDVQILVGQSPYEGFAAALAKKIAGWCGRRVVLVVENHGDFEESVFLQREIAFPQCYRFLMQRTAKFSLENADFVRAISSSTRKQLERWLPGRPVTQFPTWTDLDTFLRDDMNGERSGSQEIVYAGVLIPRKGVHYLIGAFERIAKEFPDACLVIVGSEDNRDYAQELKNQVKRLRLDRRVRFMKAMPQEKLARQMGKSRVCVLPSVSEALGRVVVEAMATKTPVIGSNVGGIPDMVTDGVSGFLVPPGDESALADKIRWFLGHPDEAEAMGHRARGFAERFFSAEAYVAGYRQIFEASRGPMRQEERRAPSAV
jgi:glycosyltransferase involved in cell wall biosynthesis